MAKSNEIGNILSKDKISMQVYPQYYFDNFNPELEFVKWATVEVNTFKGIPDDLESYTLNGGLYAFCVSLLCPPVRLPSTVLNRFWHH